MAMNFDNIDFGFSNPEPPKPPPIPNPFLPSPQLQGPTLTPPFYIVVAPEKVRPFCDFDVAVTVVGTSQPVSVTVGLYGSEKDNTFIKTAVISVQPNTTHLAKIPIKELRPDEYNLSVQGDDYFRFETSTNLRFVEKFQSIFIQTDRAMYKPGHKVRFRVLVLDSKLKPSTMNRIDVVLKDGQSNRVKEWKKVEATKGVFSNEIQLSPHPVLGDWSIIVKANGKEQVKRFTVAEYVLPKFEVSVDVPQHATYANSTVPVLVSAKYTYGQPVKGEATIKVRPQYTFFKEDVKENSKVIKVDTVGKTEIDVVSALKLEGDKKYSKPMRTIPVRYSYAPDFQRITRLENNQYYERTIQFDVAFKEDLTGKVLNGSACLKLHHAKCKVDFQKIFDFLMPGDIYKTLNPSSPAIRVLSRRPDVLTSKALASCNRCDDGFFHKLKISNWDDTPYAGPKNTPVRVRYGRGWADRENATWKEYQLPQTGVIELNFQTEDGTEVLNIEAEYMGVTAYDTVVRKQLEDGKNSSALDLTILNDKPKIGDTLEVDVYTKGDASFLCSHVIGRSEMTEAKTTLLSEGQHTTRLKVPVTQTMAPESHIVLLYISNKGEIVAAEKEIKVDNVLSNFLKISAAPNEAEPGKEAAISIESRPNSIVGLMGVDQSVILLKKGNDISREDVENDLRGYDNTWYGGGRSWGKSRRSTVGWLPGYSARDIFSRAGSVILTNAYLPEEKFLVPAAGMLFGSAVPGGMVLAACGSSAIPLSSTPLAGELSRPLCPVLPPVVVRSAFPETWIWDLEDLGAHGKTSVRKVVPDTITSWVITGFSLSPEHGLGLSDDPAQVRVFRPFFISLNLPYSVTREESLLLPVNVFNYMDRELKVDVTLENPGWFTFVPTNPSAQSKKRKNDSDSARTKTIVVASNSAASVNYVITPKQVGYLEVKVTARSALAGDGVSRKLLVKPEGETQYRTKGILVDLRTKKEFQLDVELDIPNDIVPDSELIEVSVVGDLLGSALENLDRLIRQPYGCGEQNMLNFVPNIVILDYLKTSNQLTNTIQQKALKYLELGYQRELTYRHKDNSFSAFGEHDKSGSTWLTAFVSKSFKQAQKFIDIESSAIIDPLRWIAAKQNRNGSFPEVGQVFHKQMQGGGSNGLALTAYVLTAFVESMSLTEEFKETIDRAARFINEQIEKGNADTYSLAVTSYALNFAGHPAKDKAFQLLESKSKTEGESKWWEKDKEKDKENDGNLNPWDTCIPNAINVEVTAYAMLSYLYRNMHTEALPILRWLLSQQNSEGGFASTQDTVTALGSIARLAKKIVGKNKDMSIMFEYPPGGSTKLKLNQDNALVLQKAELPSKKVRHISVDAKGTGLGIVQISYRYNVDKKGAYPLFNLAPNVDAASTRDHLILAVTTSYTGGKESNMAVMEVTLPTGFTIDDEGVKALKMTDKIKKVETKDEETVVILYFDKVTSESMCPVISAYKSFKVAKQRPVPVTIYDYYDNSRRATEFYSPKPSEICDLCEADDCQHCDITA